VDIWGERVTLRDGEGQRRTVELRDLREEVARGGEPASEGKRAGKENPKDRAKPSGSE